MRTIIKPKDFDTHRSTAAYDDPHAPNARHIRTD